MRHKLNLLSNLRALLVNRAVFIGFLFAALCAAPFSRAHALQARSRHKEAHATATHRHVAAARAHSSRSVSVSRRRVERRRPAVVRTRMPIRHYGWMSQRRSSAAARGRMVPTPVTGNAPRPGIPTPQTSVAEVSEPNDVNTASPQEAARQIAAAEIPAAPHAMMHAATLAPNPFGSTSIVAMAPLRGSLESLIRQNEKTNADNLERIQDDADLNARIANGQLVRVPESGGLTVNGNLPEDRRYCRPWTAKFLADLSNAHQAQFHNALEVSSAVRTVEYQKRLMRTNGNAAPAEGDVASPHLTGATIDIAKKGLTRSELYWMRNRLDALQNEGKIDVEEEFRQACFHITVYKSYIGAGPAHKPAPHTVTPPDDDQATPADSADDAAHPAV
ncbi:MAG TPA: DUF5715 family protein [Terracidiphilus sp.]|nr:DUF5715 family protein [Terracidiphilus sp.]